MRNPKASLFDVCYGAQTYVAVGSAGTILTSADAQTWKAAPSGTTNLLRSVCYGDGKFVTVGQSSIILVSHDSANWQPGFSTGLKDLKGVAFGNSLFMAVGDGGGIETSTDGEKWTARAADPNVYWECVAFGNGQFRGAGRRSGGDSGNLTFISTNGVDFYYHFRPDDRNAPDDTIEGITWGSDQFIAVGGQYPFDYYGKIYSLSGGTSQPNPLPYLYDVAWGNSRYVAVGIYGATWTSTNGYDWAKGNSGSFSRLYGVTYGDRKFVTVGSGGTIATSSDGAHWQGGEIPVTCDFSKVAYGNQKFVAVGGKRDSPYSDPEARTNRAVVVTSEDGRTWTNFSVTVTNSIYDVAYGSNLFVAVGYQGAIITSPDGISWTRQVSGSSADLVAVAFGKGVFVALGSGRNQHQIFSSSDGSHWILNMSGTNGLSDVVWTGNQFVAVGGYYGTRHSQHPVVYTSRDGTDWQMTSIPVFGILESVTCGMGKIVATGSCNLAGQCSFSLASDDGLHWSKGDISYLNVSDVTYGSGLFVTVGNYGILFISSDGITWNKQWFDRDLRETVNVYGPSFYGITYGKGSFVVVGEGGAILQSEKPASRLRVTKASARSQLEVFGDPESEYQIQFSTNLVDWVDSATVVRGESETMEGTKETPHKFYRAVAR